LKEDHLTFRAAILATLSTIGLPFAVSAQEPGPALGRIYDALEVTRGPQVVQAPRLSVPDGFDLATVRDKPSSHLWSIPPVVLMPTRLSSFVQETLSSVQRSMTKYGNQCTPQDGSDRNRCPSV